MKKIIIILIIIMLAGSAIGGIVLYYKSTQKLSGKELKIAYNYWPSVFWIEIAESKGWFKEAGLNIKLVDYNTNWFQSKQDLIDEKIDVAGITMFDVVMAQEQGSDLTVVINNGISLGSDVLVAQKGIESVSDLKDKHVGVIRGSGSEYELSIALEKNGLTLDDIKQVEINAENAVDAIGSNQVDAIMTWEPYASDSIEQFDAKKIFDTSEVVGLMPDVIALKKSFIIAYPEEVLSLVKVWYKTTEFIKNNPDEALGIIATKYNYKIDEVSDFMKVDQIYSLKDNINSFAYSSNRLNTLHGNINSISKYLLKQGISTNGIDSTKIIDPSFIRALIK